MRRPLHELSRSVPRRHFLAGAAAALAAPHFVSRGAFGANDRIAIGAIGTGGRGGGHVRTFLGHGDTQVVAVCDPYLKKREQAKQWADQRYGDRAGQAGYKGCTAYADFRDLVARDDIDAVVIASPEFWHAHHSVWAMRSGKDVYCEKAMTLTLAEGQAVVDATRRFGR
ncbi:Gfo/Idh/MocA family oxidoreductase, partial [bacterium]|nr:Gfo/Idh/MocA family oxidoreductase [bacterium]